MDLLLIFLSGIFTALGPCVLSILPISLAYTFSISNNKKDGFFVSLFFVLGLAVIFSILGVLFSLFGSVFNLYRLKFIAGILAIIFGVLIILNYNIKIFNFSAKGKIWNKALYVINKNRKFKYLSSFLFGFCYGVLANTCADPVLVSILSYISTKGDILYGFFALFVYAIGFGIPIIILSSLGVEGKEILSKINPKIVNPISGTILILLGIWILI